MENWLTVEKLASILKVEESLKNSTIVLLGRIELCVVVNTKKIMFTIYDEWIEVSMITGTNISEISVITNIPIFRTDNENFSDHVRYVVRGIIYNNHSK